MHVPPRLTRSADFSFVRGHFSFVIAEHKNWAICRGFGDFFAATNLLWRLHHSVTFWVGLNKGPEILFQSVSYFSLCYVNRLFGSPRCRSVLFFQNLATFSIKHSGSAVNCLSLHNNDIGEYHRGSVFKKGVFSQCFLY